MRKEVNPNSKQNHIVQIFISLLKDVVANYPTDEKLLLETVEKIYEKSNHSRLA